VISLNGPAVLPDREGVFVTGSLPYVDADRWRALLEGKDGPGSSFSPSLDLKIAALDFGGRRLNDVTLRAARAAPCGSQTSRRRSSKARSPGARRASGASSRG